MNAPLYKTLESRHSHVDDVLTDRKTQRKRDAKALAELIYDVYKEKKRKENDKIVMDQNNAQLNSSD